MLNELRGNSKKEINCFQKQYNESIEFILHRSLSSSNKEKQTIFAHEVVLMNVREDAVKYDPK